jgi:hypothetical protein
MQGNRENYDPKIVAMATTLVLHTISPPSLDVDGVELIACQRGFALH